MDIKLRNKRYEYKIGFEYQILADDSAVTYIGNKQNKKFPDGAQAREYLVTQHREKVAQIAAKLPPLSIPTPATLKSLPFPLIASLAKNGIRVQYFKTYLFDEAGQYLCQVEKQYYSHSWGVITVFGKKYTEEEIRGILANQTHVTYYWMNSIISYSQPSKPIFESSYPKTIGEVLSIKPKWNDSGIYFQKKGALYEMGYRGHQSEHFFYLPYHIETRCQFIKKIEKGKSAIMWTNGESFVATKIDSPKFKNVTVMYLDVDEAGLPISAYYYGM